MKFKLLYLSFILSFLFVPLALSQATVTDLSVAISNGSVTLEQSKGTGASSGNSVEGILQNQTNQEINVEVYLSKPVYLKNRGAGQNMIASQIYNKDGGYFSDGKKSFITLKPRAESPITFVAYCADFEKQNPSSGESFTLAEVPPSLKKVISNITNFAKGSPNVNITVAAQVAVWLAQGESAGEIMKKFPFTVQDERRARSFLK